MHTITMLSRAESVEGQGVGSAFSEQMSLLRSELSHDFRVKVNVGGQTDLLHVHTINPEYRIRIATSSVPTLGAVHFIPSTLEGSIKLPRFARGVFYKYLLNFYRSLDHLVTVNPMFVHELEKLGFDPARVHSIPNYVDPTIFHPLSREERIVVRDTFGISSDTFVVIGVGQVQKRKGILDFLDVARMHPEMRFLWVGGFSFGSITDGYDELKRVMEHPPHNVHFTGIVPRADIPVLYGMADALLLPSYAELFPMTILEAASTATPLVLRDLQLYEPIIGSDYLKATSPEGFASRLVELRDDPTARAAAQSFSLSIRDRYSAETVAGMWKELYLSLIEEPRHR